MDDDILRMAREEAEDWRSRYELISLEVSFWRKRHDMLLQAMADNVALTVTPPRFLANKEAYELGRLNGVADEREACAKVCEAMPDLEYGWKTNLPGDCAAAIRARSKE